MPECDIGLVGLAVMGENLVLNMESRGYQVAVFNRTIMMMVKAGPAVDELIGELLPLLGKGDILIDGGNTYFPDTNRRTVEVEKAGLLFVGSGVSGGEEGALKGPSIMPGGS